ncbi:MAG: lactate dehydrogenase [Alphaproteobacteria bacterium]|nr:lactate dehydrogenase [Alphaproteobacteria bacterium]
MPAKIALVTPFPSVGQVARDMLPAGYELIETDARKPEFLASIKAADYFIGAPPVQLGEAFFKAAPGLKLVQLISAGYDRWDLDAARAAGVPIANNGGSNSVAVAEHALMLMLATMRKMVVQHRNVISGRWRGPDAASFVTYELEGRTLGIIGLGTIGKKVARRALAFGMAVQYYDIVRLTEDQEDALGVRFKLRQEILATSDIVTLHVPLTPASRDMIGEAELALMKPSAILINTARGPLVQEAALHRALSNGTIAGAGLDVLVEEPPPQNHAFFSLENVILTPHLAGPTYDNWFKAFRNAYDNVERVRRGDAPLWVVAELRSLIKPKD